MLPQVDVGVRLVCEFGEEAQRDAFPGDWQYGGRGAVDPDGRYVRGVHMTGLQDFGDDMPQNIQVIGGMVQGPFRRQAFPAGQAVFHDPVRVFHDGRCQDGPVAHVRQDRAPG